MDVNNTRRSFHLKNVSSIYRFNRDNKEKAIQKSLDYILYNLGTVTYRSTTVNENNLTRADDIGIISPQDQFERKTGEDSSYLNDFSDS